VVTSTARGSDGATRKSRQLRWQEGERVAKACGAGGRQEQEEKEQEEEERGERMTTISGDTENGFGKLRWESGNEYEGQWKGGKRHGRGVLTREDGK
jgi:hypothetical protein